MQSIPVTPNAEWRGWPQNHMAILMKARMEKGIINPSYTIHQTKASADGMKQVKVSSICLSQVQVRIMRPWHAKRLRVRPW